MDTHRDIPRRLALIGLIVILTIGAWMRFEGLGRYAFWTDEMYHVIAAQSVLDCGEPVIPARGTYWRSFLVTAMTAGSFRVFGDSEWSARLPFAVVSLAFLVIAYRILAARFTRLLALITVGFIALTPQFLQAGRECRMYALFALLYFIGVFATYRAVESPPGGDRRGPAGMTIGLILAALAFAIAMSLQFLAVSFGLSLAVYCLLMAGWLAIHDGLSEAIRSRYTVLLGVMAMGLAACALALPGTVARFLDLARTPLDWDTRGAPAPFCLWFFTYYYPALWFLYPLGAVILARRHGRLGVFVICAFVPVLLAHMYLFTARIAERYLLYILPFFFLASAGLIEALAWVLTDWVRRLGVSGARATAAAALLAAIPAVYLFLHPWLSVSQQLRRYGLGPDWKRLSEELHDVCNNSTVITNWPREVMYYGGRFPDYFATRTYEYWDKPDHTVRIGSREVPVNYLTDAETLHKAIQDNRDVYFVTTDWAFYNDAFMNDPMRDLILGKMEEVAAAETGNDRAVIYRVRAHQP